MIEHEWWWDACSIFRDREQKRAEQRRVERTSTTTEWIVCIYKDIEHLYMYDYKRTKTFETAKRWAERAVEEGLFCDLYKQEVIGSFIRSYP